MEPRLIRLLSSFEKAHTQLTKALAQPKDEFVRDAAIQRVEFTFEATVAETIYASLPAFADAMHAVIAKIQAALASA